MFLLPSVLCIFPGATHENTGCSTQAGWRQGFFFFFFWDILLGVTGQSGIYDVSVRLKREEMYGSLRGGRVDTQNWHVHKLIFPLLIFSLFSASSLRAHFWFSWMCPGAKIAAKRLWMSHSDAPIITITKKCSDSNCDKNTLSKEITFWKKNKTKKTTCKPLEEDVKSKIISHLNLRHLTCEILTFSDLFIYGS